MATTVKIQPDDYARLARLAKELGRPMTSILGEALAEYEKRAIFREADVFYKALRGNRRAWSEEMSERRQIEDTAAERLEEWPYEAQPGRSVDGGTRTGKGPRAAR